MKMKTHVIGIVFFCKINVPEVALDSFGHFSTLLGKNLKKIKICLIFKIYSV